jgi:tRNA nucleotidyltransferase (CCA-adding enzyme)
VENMNAPASQEFLSRLRALPGAEAILGALAGVEGVHVVGGAPRDLLLGRPALDLDLVVEGDAEAAARVAAERLGGSVRVHDRFGTATVIAGEHSFDLAMARTEAYPRPGALPEVAPASIAEDLQRRDFTVNAIAVAVGPPAPGTVHAHPRAHEDLAALQLRVTHDASFRDDPTRILRAVRYAHRLGFSIEPHTVELLQAAVVADAFSTVSPSRIGDELRLLLREPDVATALNRLFEMGLDRALHPDFEVFLGLTADALWHLPAGGRPDLLALATACMSFEPEELRRWLDALEFTAADREIVVAAAKPPDIEPGLSRSALAARLRGVPVEAVAVIAGRNGEESPDAERWLSELRHVRTEISGEDLLAAGVPEGPDVGRALDAALAARLDGEATDKQGELRAALTAIKSSP